VKLHFTSNLVRRAFYKNVNLRPMGYVIRKGNSSSTPQDNKELHGLTILFNESG